MKAGKGRKRGDKEGEGGKKPMEVKIASVESID
jgi:hypothetical protein